MAENQESITAKICAFSRAYHSYSEGEKIFDDYLAYDILGQEEYEQIGQMIEAASGKDYIIRRLILIGSMYMVK